MPWFLLLCIRLFLSVLLINVCIDAYRHHARRQDNIGREASMAVFMTLLYLALIWAIVGMPGVPHGCQ